MTSEGFMIPGKSDSSRNLVVIRDSFTGFLETAVRAEARESIRDSSVQVLEKALRAGSRSTGLVVGRVQSGKTLSYEGVISLARDNGFALVVVISGISNPLLAQGEDRLSRDLAAADQDGWTFLSPAADQQSSSHVGNELLRANLNWSNADTPSAFKQTTVVFTLKNWSRIRDLARTLKDVGFSDSRVLVIDDEADQASLNTQGKKGKESSTYASIRLLRDSLPNHYYLQYTATPQAPLLAAIEDQLSPDFVHVLEPGSTYVGGQAYFGDNSNTIVVPIDQNDLRALDTPGGPPPASLRRALQEFLLGAAHTLAAGTRPETRSMLVHPSRGTNDHAVFLRWVRSMVDNWREKYSHSDETPPTNLKAEFQNAWKGLRITFPEIAEFERCWASLEFVFQNLGIEELNSRQGKTPVIKWARTKFYILIGGQAIDRGFTVEGLTVTYMPRPGGTMTADTIQQRARFFGYKAPYLGLCRVYLDPLVRDAFENYVQHEIDMLESLRDIQHESYSLKEWRRRFYLDPSMKPTRASVIDIPLLRVAAVDRWITDTYPVRDDAISLAEAHTLAMGIMSHLKWSNDGYGNLKSFLTYAEVLELLEHITPQSLFLDSNYQALSFQLARLRDEVEADENAVAVFLMRPKQEISIRTETARGAVQVFQGRNSSAKGHPGDREIYDHSKNLTLQLHSVRVLSRQAAEPQGEYLLAAWRLADASSSFGWLVQGV